MKNDFACVVEFIWTFAMVIDFYSVRYIFFALFSFFLFSKNIARIMYLYWIFCTREQRENFVFRLVTKDFTDIFRDFLLRNILFLDTCTCNAENVSVIWLQIGRIFSCKKKKEKERRKKSKRRRNWGTIAKLQMIKLKWIMLERF